jgi:hypothetical protein
MIANPANPSIAHIEGSKYGLRSDAGPYFVPCVTTELWVL